VSRFLNHSFSLFTVCMASVNQGQESNIKQFIIYKIQIPVKKDFSI